MGSVSAIAKNLKYPVGTVQGMVKGPPSRPTIEYDFNIGKNENIVLSCSVNKFTNQEVFFELNTVNNEIKIFNILLKYLNKKISVDAKYINSDNNEVYCIFRINDFVIEKLPNLFTNNPDTSGFGRSKEIKIKYSFRDVDYIDHSKLRYLKLAKILNLKETMYTIKKENIL